MEELQERPDGAHTYCEERALVRSSHFASVKHSMASMVVFLFLSRGLRLGAGYRHAWSVTPKSRPGNDLRLFCFCHFQLLGASACSDKHRTLSY